MEVTIKFNMPDEQEEFDEIMDAKKKCREYLACLVRIERYVHGKIKYPSDEMTEDHIAALIQIRNLLPDLEE